MDRPAARPGADVLMTCGVKVYTQLSCRRFACDLQDAADRGQLTRMINPTTVCSFLESASLTPILENLIEQSALPLRAVESQFAIDSTGFSTSRFVRWFDHKWGKERQEHTWIKAHFATGTLRT